MGRRLVTRELHRGSALRSAAALLFVAVLAAAQVRAQSAPFRLSAPPGAAPISWTPVTDARLLDATAEPGNWLQYSRSADGWRYSPLARIDATNVKQLTVKWMFPLGEPADQEGHAVVNDGIMILPTSSVTHNTVYALDAATGRLFWRWTRQLPEDLTAYARVHPHARGVALYDDIVIVPTLDAKLVALEARTGNPRWQATVADYKDGHFINSPPLIARGTLVTGTSGPGEMGLRGFAAAYDPRTGRELWKTYMVPQPGERGSDTWQGETWRRGGGALWLPATYDRESDLVYFGTGNPSPNVASLRPGDNLFTSSAVALDRTTGRIRWHFQYVPNDAWDFDTNNEHTLVPIRRGGAVIPAVLSAQKSGFLYALDRRDGTLLYATKFARDVDWADRIDPRTGRPVERPGARAIVGGPKVDVCPSALGARNWAQSSYSPQTHLLYVPTTELCMRYAYVRSLSWTRGLTYSGMTWEPVMKGDQAGVLRAYDPESGATVWEHWVDAPLLTSGVLATGGGLVLFQTLDGELRALDARTGALLYRLRNGLIASAAPVSYTVGDTQLIAVVAGGKSRLRRWLAPEPKLAYLQTLNLSSMLIVYGLPDQ